MSRIFKDKGNADKRRRVRADERASANTCCPDGHSDDERTGWGGGGRGRCAERTGTARARGAPPGQGAVLETTEARGHREGSTSVTKTVTAPASLRASKQMGQKWEKKVNPHTEHLIHSN